MKTLPAVLTLAVASAVVAAASQAPSREAGPRARISGIVVNAEDAAQELARGLPVIATEVGGMPEALCGGSDDGDLPGVLIRPGDAAALAAALRSWLGDGALRKQLRLAALERRDSLTGWSETSARVARVLAEVAR